MGSRTRLATARVASLLAAVGLLAAAAPAHAISCSEWQRLAPYQKSTRIDDLIHDAIAGQGGRQYNVNRGALERCLYGQAVDIEYAFDDACSDARTASMQALNRIFKDYIWSCVR